MYFSTPKNGIMIDNLIIVNLYFLKMKDDSCRGFSPIPISVRKNILWIIGRKKDFSIENNL